MVMTHMKTTVRLFVHGAAILLASGHLAWSQTTIFSDRGRFWGEAHSLPGIQQFISFADLYYTDEGPVVTISNVTFTGRYLTVGQVNSPDGYRKPALFNFEGTSPLRIHFANGARAFGADFSSDVSLYFSNFTATVSLSSGENFSFSAPSRPNSTFFGFVSPTPITDVTFSDGGIVPIGVPPVYLHGEMIGDVWVVLEIPEPCGGGLLVLGAAAWLWRKR